MRYQLALELKKAGFPQKRHYDVVDYLPEPLSDGSCDKEDFIALPTLEELIEECGDGFLHLTYYGDKNTETTFRAESGGHRLLEKTRYGATPTEAVARLWLVLNTTRSTADSNNHKETTGELAALTSDIT